MKKFITLLLVLAGYVCSVSATSYTVTGEVQNGTATNLDLNWSADNSSNHMSNESGDVWVLSKPGVVITAGTTIAWKVCLEDDWETNYGADPNNSSNGANATTYFENAGTYDLVFAFNASTHVLNLVYISSADLYGSFSGWGASGTLTRTGVGTYTGTLDLSTTNNDQLFKLVISNPITSGTSGGWIGYGSMTTFTAPTDWITNSSDNISLSNSSTGYKTYTVTAQWTPSSDNCTGWTLTIAGDEERTNNSYSVSFVKVRDWQTVNAYAYSTLGGSDNNTDYVSSWPGTAIAKSGTYNADNGLTYDVYTYSFSSTFVPQYIIFNDGTYQTSDLTFTNGNQYADEVPSVVYAPVGANDTSWNQTTSDKLFFSGYWDSENTTDFMTLGADGHTYFINFKNQQLSNGTTIYTKVISKATTTDKSGISWYPNDNKQWTITADGTYDVLITIDTSYYDESVGYINPYNSNAVTLSVTSTPSTVNVSAGSYGKSTFSSEYPLDFTDITDVAAYTVSDLSSTAATLTKMTGVVPAETGLIIIGDADANADVPTTTVSGSVGTNYLQSALNTTTINSNYAYVLFTDGLFHPANAGIIPAGKAYLLASDIPTSARSLSLVFSDESTGINTVEDSRMNADGFYNLAGQRVAAPTKGLYIVNGKKVIIK